MSRKPCGREVPSGSHSQVVDKDWGVKRVCAYERAKGKQRCHWHWLASQSTDVQAEASRARRQRALSNPASDGVPVARVPKEFWPDGERWCAGCQSFVPIWYCQGSRCTGCVRQAAHERRVESTYGITPEEYDRIWAAQGKRCGVCRAVPRSIRFAVDHDHKTGAVRGILCKRCNHDLLGGAHDSVTLLFRAIEYLLYPPSERDVRPDRTRVLRALDEHLASQQPSLRVQAQEPPF